MNRKPVSLVVAALFAFGAATAMAADAPSSDQPMTDSYITTKVKAELASDSATPSRHISVKTKDGVVALTGTVDSADQKQKAEEDVRSVKGVKDVVNSLEVKPKS
jgi:hyperosmotically inducible protein